jgi:multimeric flavodoxin WrbA
MKVIGFVFSPRKKGNTAWTVNKLLEGAKEKGAEIQTWYFSDFKIKPCQGCLACHKDDGDGGCVINDDMKKLYDALDQADAAIFGSPVYMGQMSAQAKTFTDRLFAYISPRFSPHFKERRNRIKLILAFTQGNPDPGKFRAYFDYTKQIFQWLEFDVKEVIIVAGTRNGPAHEKKDLHTSMKDIGSSLVSG